jgi:hypothetical protein
MQTIAIFYLVSDVVPSVPRGGGDHLPFIDQGEGDVQVRRTYLATWGGMVYSPVEMTSVLASPAPVAAPWRALFLNRGASRVKA